MKKTLLTLAALTLGTFAIAQEHICGTPLQRERLIQMDPTFLAREAALDEELRQLILNNTVQRGDDYVITIPVVFHIQHLKGAENISDDRIILAMQNLNEDFNAQNNDLGDVIPVFQDIIGNTRVEFKLATKDRYGNCTNGINRVQSVQTFLGCETSKEMQWPRAQYLNIWVAINACGAGGYVIPPGGTEGFAQFLDGIMVRTDATGVMNPQSRHTISHEMGHMFSLQHTWGQTNVPNVECGDDGVLDTPITRGSATGTCDTTLNVCNKPSLADEAFDFAGVTTGSGTTDPTPVPVLVDTTDASVFATFSPFNAVGVSANSTVNGEFAFSNWDLGATGGDTAFDQLTGAINTGKYYELTITPEPGNRATFQSITFSMNRNETGIRTFAVRSSASNFNTNIPLTFTPPIDPLLSLQTGNVVFYTLDTDVQRNGITAVIPSTGHTSVNQPITFRFYGWNAEDGDGSFAIDNVVINGAVGRIENVQNIMDYSSCPKMFTMGQSDRMRALLNTTSAERSNLWTEQNLIETGVYPGTEVSCGPEADFYAVVGNSLTTPQIPFNPLTCTGTQVRFVDNSSRAFATEWNWVFDGGTPGTSTEKNPTVTYDTPGWKRVTLTASNAHGSSTMVNDYSVMISSAGDAWQGGGFYEGYEHGSTTLWPMQQDNHHRNHTEWQTYNGPGAVGNGCAMLNSGDRNPLNLMNPDNVQDIDDLYSPTLGLQGTSNLHLSFFYSYSTQTTIITEATESLEVYSSTDCGRTWQLRANINGAELITNGSAPGPGIWVLRSIPLPQSVLSPTTRFRFRFTSSAYSNNLYLDEIKVSGPVGIEETAGNSMLSLFPNPTNDRFQLQAEGMETMPTEVIIMDLRGAMVFSNVFAPTGGQGLELDGRALGLADGMYTLMVRNEAGTGAAKLIMSR